MRLESPEGDAGFPGHLSVQVRYAFDDDGTLTIGYEAASDAPTPVNLTSHPYFNLERTAGLRYPEPRCCSSTRSATSRWTRR